MKNLTVCFFVLLSVLVATAQTELPNMTLKNLDGKDVKLQDISADGKLVVISLWATWCVPCKNELDAINEVYNDWQESTGVTLYAITTDDARTVNRVKPMVNGKGWEYEILYDTNNDLKRALGAATIPLTLIVKNNKILYKHSGYTPGAEDELYAKLQEYSK